MTVTPPRVVLPFYLYASLAFLVSTVLLFISGENFTGHYFHPHTLAITHMMALGWGTMMIMGASHQLVPVITGRHLYRFDLARLAFYLAAVGIPLLVYSFYQMDMGPAAKWGGRLVLLSVILFLVNIIATTRRAGAPDVHCYFILAAACWLLITVVLGLVLVYNFTYQFLPRSSLAYLPVHSHTGIVGWFLLLVIGVGSRLFPMFLLSKYTNRKLLWAIFFLVNLALVAFILSFFLAKDVPVYLIPMGTILTALFLFAYYCYRCFTNRMRKRVDDPMKLSLLSVLMMMLPVIVLAVLVVLLITGQTNTRLVLVYGFVIFFGWITAIILGMTFKTLPFIIWNKNYQSQMGLHPVPAPADLFHHGIFRVMAAGYLLGFTIFIFGAVTGMLLLLNISALLLILTATLYNWNVIKMLLHKPRPA
jgi:hypothetical protein